MKLLEATVDFFKNQDIGCLSLIVHREIKSYTFLLSNVFLEEQATPF